MYFAGLRVRDLDNFELRLLQPPILNAEMVGLHRRLTGGRTAAITFLGRRLVQPRSEIVGGERRILLGGRGGLLHEIRGPAEPTILNEAGIKPATGYFSRSTLPV